MKYSRVTRLFIGLASSCSWIAVAEPVVSGKIQQLADTIHFEFTGASKWDLGINKSSVGGNNEFEIITASLTAASISELKAFSSEFIKSIKVDHQGADGRDRILLSLPGKNWQYFQYTAKDSNQMVLDIYPEKAPGPSARLPAREISNAAALPRPPKKPEGNEAHRSPATTDILQLNPQGPIVSENSTALPRAGLFDASDPDFQRFQIKDFEIREDSIIAKADNFYIALPVLRESVEDFENFHTHKPLYEIKPTDSQENKEVRLLLTLYKKKRLNTFLKTLPWIVKKYPKSPYLEMLSFMKADVLLDQWIESQNPNDFDLAMMQFSESLDKYPQSTLSERTQLFMGFATLTRGDFLNAIRLFEKVLKSSKLELSKDRARIGIAEAYLKLSRYDEAIDTYKAAEQSSPNPQAKIEAAYRAGDAEMMREQYVKAIELYKHAQSLFPEGARSHPNMLYNIAAAQFATRNFRDSLNKFHEFIRTFPTHPFTAYALTRVGELLDIMGAPGSRSRGAYLETAFRFGDAPSAIIARLRMLSQGMAVMKPSEVEQAVSQIQELTKKSDLSRINVFSVAMIADGYTSRGDFDRAIKLLVDFYQTHATGGADGPLIIKRIVQNINDKILSLVDSGKFMEALSTHKTYSKTWLRNSDRIDTKIGIARAFEQAGAIDEAEHIFRESLNQIIALRGTKFEKTKKVVEKLPPEEALFLRLAKCHFQKEKLAESYDDLKNIKNPEMLAEDQQVERVQLAAAILQKRGELDSAKRYILSLIKAWGGQPRLMQGPYFQLAQVEADLGLPNDAVKSLHRVDDLAIDSGETDNALQLQALQKIGDIELKQSHKDAAIDAWQRALELFENKKAVEPIRYKLGKIYFDEGRIPKANEIWSGLRKNEASLWWRLAQEQLKSAEFSETYKKYIKRIPAMSAIDSERTNQ